MLAIIGELIPLALAVALSSVPIMVTVTILLAPHGRGSALTFLIGWLLGMFVVIGLFSLGLHAVPADDRSQTAPFLAVAELLIGLGLCAYGGIYLKRGRDRAREDQLPRWLRAVGGSRPILALGLSLVLNIRPKALLLAAAVGLIVGPSGLGVGATIIVLVIFVVLGGSTVGVPVVLTLARPEAMRHPLEATREWIVHNSRTVTGVVVIVVGTVVFGSGLGKF